MIRSNVVNYLFFVFASLIISCSQNKSISDDDVLLDGFFFQKSRITVTHSALLNDATYFRYAQTDSVLMLWNTLSNAVVLLSFPDFDVTNELDLNSLSLLEPILDVSWHDGSLYLVGTASAIDVFQTKSHTITKLRMDSVLADVRFRAFSTYNYPIYVENSTIYLFGNSTSNVNYLTIFSDQQSFFSAPLEITYDMSDGSMEEYSSYPSLYRDEELNFYLWPPRRNRLHGQSIYSFPHIDSLYVQSDNSESLFLRGVARKSALSNRQFIPLDKSSLIDYSYLQQYSQINDHYSELITDPYRGLIYSIFVPGIDPSESARIRPAQIAFTIMIFDEDLEFQKEVFFPADLYDHRLYFVSPEGLCLHTSATINERSRVFDVFDFSKTGDAQRVYPQNLKVKIEMLPLVDYLHQNFGLDKSTDSVVVISGIGCESCLNSIIWDAQSEEMDRHSYTFIATLKAARSRVVMDFLSKQKNTFIDKEGMIEQYKFIGDFLSLLVIEGDSIVSTNSNFEF